MINLFNCLSRERKVLMCVLAGGEDSKWEAGVCVFAMFSCVCVCMHACVRACVNYFFVLIHLPMYASLCMYMHFFFLWVCICGSLCVSMRALWLYRRVFTINNRHLYAIAYRSTLATVSQCPWHPSVLRISLAKQCSAHSACNQSYRYFRRNLSTCLCLSLYARISVFRINIDVFVRIFLH